MKTTIITIRNNFQSFLNKDKEINVSLINTMEHLYEHLNDTMCDDIMMRKECQLVREELRTLTI